MKDRIALFLIQIALKLTSWQVVIKDLKKAEKALSYFVDKS